jgi:ribose 5-phosphate isomerase B
MKIALAADHAGLAIKEAVKRYLLSLGYKVEDFGTNTSESMDYPDVAHPAAKAVSEGRCERGIMICGTGQGMQLVANKYPNIRAALCWNTEIAELSRKHNDANVLTMPGRFLEEKTAIDITRVWLETEFEGGRHKRRVNKIHVPAS